MTSPFDPSPGLLAKLGSIVVHADEYFSNGGHDFDAVSVRALLQDPEVHAWLVEMDKMAMLPKKRV